MSELIQACQHPSKEDIAQILTQIPAWKTLTVKVLIGEIMRHFKGACNPAVIREWILEIVNDENAKIALKCDLCHNIFHIGDVELNEVGKQFLCGKCRSPEPSARKHLS